MLTTDKAISTPEYWNSLYRGERNNATVDSSNGVRPKQSFDRFDAVVKHAEGPKVLGVASGHAHIEKRIKALHKDWEVYASDQCKEAEIVSKYHPYLIQNAYNLSMHTKAIEDNYKNVDTIVETKWDIIICTQALEYMEDLDRAMTEFKRVAKKFICTIPLGEMKSWSQLRIFNEDDFCNWLSNYGDIEVRENYGELLLVKIKFND